MRTTHRRLRARFDVKKLVADMSRRGWNASDLARASDLSAMTVGEFIKGSTQTPKTADKLARALGYTAERYFLGVKAA